MDSQQGMTALLAEGYYYVLIIFLCAYLCKLPHLLFKLKNVFNHHLQGCLASP